MRRGQRRRNRKGEMENERRPYRPSPDLTTI